MSQSSKLRHYPVGSFQSFTVHDMHDCPDAAIDANARHNFRRSKRIEVGIASLQSASLI